MALRLQVLQSFRRAFRGRVAADDSIGLHLASLPLDHMLGRSIFDQANNQAEPTAASVEGSPTLNQSSLGGRFLTRLPICDAERPKTLASLPASGGRMASAPALYFE